MTNSIQEQVDAIMNNASSTVDKKKEELKRLYEYARAEQRAASESMMVDDDGLNNDLRAIEMALENLGTSQPVEKQAKSAASL